MANAVLRALLAAVLAVLPLALSPTLAHAAPETLSMAEAIARLPQGSESRDGYSRDSFRHWNTGTDPHDGCNISRRST